MRDRLSDLERQWVELDEQRSGLKSRADDIRSKVVDRRLDEFKGALAAEPLDRQRVNVVCRTLFDNVVINYVDGSIVLNWRHGGETEVPYAMPDAVPSEPVSESVKMTVKTASTPHADQPMP